MQLKYKLSSALATSALISSLLVGVARADVIIEGNGNNSTNKVNLSTTCNTTIGQSNTTSISTTITANANTGGNKANSNTGAGEVSIDTGDATNEVAVTVDGSMNTATVPACCPCDPAESITILDNGNNSTNKVKKPSTTNLTAGQTNSTGVATTAIVKAKTGKNKANKNTGGGAKTITTGAAVNTATVGVTTSSNTLNP